MLPCSPRLCRVGCRPRDPPTEDALSTPRVPVSPPGRRAPHCAGECGIRGAPSPLRLALPCHLSCRRGVAVTQLPPRRAGGGQAGAIVLHNLLVKSVHVALFVSDPPTCSQLV